MGKAWLSMNILSQIVNGLSIGSIYALVALGYSMVYGIVQLINFAHGDIIMVGAYAVFVLLVTLGAPLWLTVILAIAFCAVVGIVIERLAYRRLLTKSAPRISLLITAIGVSIFLQNIFQAIFGSGARSLPKMFPKGTIDFGELSISYNILINIATSIVMMICLTLLVNKTKIGKAMRATSEDAGAAKLMGINTSSTIRFTFAVGSALAAVGSLLYCNMYAQITPYMGGMLGLKAFVAAVLGGIGSLPGAMLGGYVLGVAESLTVAMGFSAISDAVVFGILILVLMLKPTGLLGKNVRVKV